MTAPIRVVVMPPNGKCRLEQIDPGHELQDLYRLIGCTTVEVVVLAPDLHMWLDEEGMVKPDRQRINQFARSVCRQLGFDVRQPFVGTAVFSSLTDDGEIAGLSADRIDYLMGAVTW